MPVSRKRFLTSILILSITAVLFLPLYTSFYLYPAFTRHLMGDAEGAAIKLANHIIHYLEEPEEGLDYEHMTVDVIEVKLFAPSGKIIYSTDPDDIGQINTKDYFKPVITSGIPFTKIVTKNSTTAEGRTVSVDVVETYQPLKFDDRIIGASEVYFDITEHRKSVTALIRHSSVIIFSVTLFLLVAVLVTLFRLNKNMIAREEVEKGESIISYANS